VQSLQAAERFRQSQLQKDFIKNIGRQAQHESIVSRLNAAKQTARGQSKIDPFSPL
jgi:hypothetical protein